MSGLTSCFILLSWFGKRFTMVCQSLKWFFHVFVNVESCTFGNKELFCTVIVISDFGSFRLPRCSVVVKTLVFVMDYKVLHGYGDEEVKQKLSFLICYCSVG